MKNENIIIAVDGLSCSGKSTISKNIAKHFGFEYLDTGSIYRAITLLALKNGFNVDNFNEDNKKSYQPLIDLLKTCTMECKYDREENKERVILNDKDITNELKTPIVSNIVAKISCIEEIRLFVRSMQYKYAEAKNIVMEGRDITTVVFPSANAKLFITTDIEKRAKNRTEDYKKLGKYVNENDVRKDLETRDHLDIFRKNSPLKIASDAYVLDTTNATPEESIAEAIAYIEEKLTKKNK